MKRNDVVLVLGDVRSERAEGEGVLDIGLHSYYLAFTGQTAYS